MKNLLVLLSLTGCASAPSMVFESECQKKIVCEKQDGPQCVVVRIETTGSCVARVVGINEIRTEK